MDLPACGCRSRQCTYDDRQHDYLCTSAQRWRHQKGERDQAIGRSRGGLTTTIYAIVNAAGKTEALSLTPEQRADITETGLLLNEVGPKIFIADKSYEAGLLIEKLEEWQIPRFLLQEETDAIPVESCSLFINNETSLNGSSPD